MSISRGLINEGEKATVSVTILNDGKADSESVFVKFYTLDNVIDSAFVSLDRGKETTVTMDWQAPVGNHQIYAVAFPTDNIMEAEEAENKRVVNLAVLTSKDLSIDLILAEFNNGILNITANISNSGYGDLTGVEVEIYGSYGTGNDTLLYSANLTQLDESTQATLYFEWAAPIGTKTVYVIVDPADYIMEKDEDNNEASERLNFGTWASDDKDDSNDHDDTMNAIYVASMMGILLLVIVVLLVLYVKKQRGDREE